MASVKNLRLDRNVVYNFWSSTSLPSFGDFSYILYYAHMLEISDELKDTKNRSRLFKKIV